MEKKISPINKKLIKQKIEEHEKNQFMKDECIQFSTIMSEFITDTISLRAARFLYSICEITKPTSILDVGSGFSSYVFRKFKQTNDVEVYSLSNNEDRRIKSTRFSESCDVPFENFLRWDDIYNLKKPFDIIFLDMGDAEKREGVLKVLIKNNINENTIFILDDMHVKELSEFTTRNFNDNTKHTRFGVKELTEDEYGRFLGVYTAPKTPLLSIMTRVHPKRQNMFSICKESLTHQTSQNFEQVLVVDESKEGQGRAYANKAFEINKNKYTINGKYVMVLDDDDKLINNNLIEDLEKIIDTEKSDMVIWRGHVDGLGNLPPDNLWMKEPMCGKIASFCFAIKKQLWDEHISEFTKDMKVGDYIFIKSIFKNSQKVSWLDNVYADTQRVSQGSAE